MILINYVYINKITDYGLVKLKKKEILMESRTPRMKNTIRNTAVSVFCYILIFLFGVLIRKVFLENIEIEFLGFEGLFSNIFAILLTLDFGIGAILLYRLYAAFSDRKKDEIRSLFGIFNRLFHFAAIAIVLFGILIMPFLRFLIHDVVRDWNFVYLIYMLQIIGSASAISLMAYRFLLVADQRQSDVAWIEMLFRILTSVFKVVAIIYTKSYLLYLMLSVLSNIGSVALIAILGRRKYPYIFLGKPDFNLLKDPLMISDIKNAALNRVMSAVHAVSDTLLISIMFGLKQVALYGNYTLIGSSVLAGFDALLAPVGASVGNLVNMESEESGYSVFKSTDLAAFAAANFVFTSMCVLYQPVITLMFGAQYLLPLPFVLLFGTSCYQHVRKHSISAFRGTVGEYKKEQIWLATSVVMNLIISIIGLRLWGLAGAALGTVLSNLLVEAGQYRIVYQYRFQRSVWQGLARTYGFLLLAIAQMGVTFLIAQRTSVTISGIVIRVGLCALIPNLITLLLFWRSDSLRLLVALIKNVLPQNHR